MSILRERTNRQTMDMAAGGKYATINPDRASNFNWSTVDVEALFVAICAVTALGDSIMFGKTSDGGAGFVMVVSGGVADKLYPTSDVEANAVLAQIHAIASRSEPP